MTHADQIRDCIHHQTDHEFPYEVNRYGCRAFVLMAIPQFVTGRCLTVEQVLNIIAHGRVTDGVLVSETMHTGTEEHHLINWAFEALGDGRTGRQVGWDAEHITTREWQYMIGHWETAGEDGHFTLFDRGQKELYDPSRDPIDKRRVVRRLLYAIREG